MKSVTHSILPILMYQYTSKSWYFPLKIGKKPKNLLLSSFVKLKLTVKTTTAILMNYIKVIFENWPKVCSFWEILFSK
jgi:hypothetical protein